MVITVLGLLHVPRGGPDDGLFEISTGNIEECGKELLKNCCLKCLFQWSATHVAPQDRPKHTLARVGRDPQSAPKNMEFNDIENAFHFPKKSHHGKYEGYDIFTTLPTNLSQLSDY